MSTRICLLMLASCVVLSSCHYTERPIHRPDRIPSEPTFATVVLGLEPAGHEELPQESRRITIELEPIVDFVPHKVGSGDADFFGHGPEVLATVNIEVRNGQVWANYFLRALETRADYTRATGSATAQVTHGEPRIVAIADGVDTFSEITYTDTNHDFDIFQGGPGELVREWQFVGDTRGPEAGSFTSVTIRFRPIDVLVTP